MAAFVLRRLLGAVPLLLGIATIIFIVLHLAPGEPAALFWGPGIPPETFEQIRRSFGLDQSLPVRYGLWLRAFVTGDFGISVAQARPVREIIAETLPNTLILTASALVLAFVIGILLGVLQAIRQYSWRDNIASVVSLFFYSMPSFWLGMMLVLLFALKAHEWGLPFALPAGGMTGIDHEFLGFWGRLNDRVVHLILPVATLTLVLAAGIARYTRAQMLDVIRQDYIRTARAKGLPERAVIFKHGLRNGLLPVITLLGLYLPILFSGAVFVEVIFSWPGMGRVTVAAIFQRDYPLIMATSFIFAAVVVAGNLLADVLYAAVDPRVRCD